MKATYQNKLIIAFLAIITITACAANTRQKTLQTTLFSVNVARNGFVAWDQATQAAIVTGATSIDDGNYKLNQHADSIAPIAEAFSLTYEALAFAAIEPTNDNLDEAIQQANILFQLVAKLTDRHK